MERSELANRKSKGLLGFEPWIVDSRVVDTHVKRDFVRVLNARKADIALPDAATRDERILYNFDILVNKARLTTTENSGLRLISMYIHVSGIQNDEDLARAIRGFEIAANTFNNSTKAKKPNYISAFGNIDMSWNAWKNLFPKL